MPDIRNLASYPGRATEVMDLRREPSTTTLNLSLYPQRSVGVTTALKKPVSSANGDRHRKTTIG